LDPARRSQLDRLIRPSSVAIVGASGDPTRTAGRPALYLRKHGFTGPVYLINPRYSELHGEPCYPDPGSLPETPDVALVLVGPGHIPSAVRGLAERGTAAAIILAGGYAEIGGAGIERERELKHAAGTMRLLGPNTIGLVNAVDRVALSASVALEIDQIEAGRVGVVSQSGGILGSLLSRAAAKGVGFSRLIATGNEADLEVNDIVEYLLDDDATSVIAVYLEGLRDSSRFRALAERAREIGKPVLVYKVGRSEPGARSAASHTGALAGSDDAYTAFLDQLGVYRLGSFADLIDVPAALAAAPAPRGRRIAIVTSTGGGGVLVADACGVLGFETPPPDAATTDKLGAAMIGDGAVPDRNPIDVTLAGLKPEVFRGVLGALVESPSYDVIVVIVGSSALADPDLAATPVIEAAGTSPKPIVVYVSPSAPHIIQNLNRHGVPAFDTPEACAAALDALWRWGARRSATAVEAAELTGASFDSLRSGSLNEVESTALFQHVGIPAPRSLVALDRAQADAHAREIGGPVVMKVLSRDIAHKSDVGGVRIGISASEAASAVDDLLSAVRTAAPEAAIDGMLVQEMLSEGVELILGCVRDPQLGPMILLGAGGIATEVYQDKVIRFPPLTQDNARLMISTLKSAPLLRGHRGRPVMDEAALADAIVAFSSLVMALGDRLVEAEINPLFVLPVGQGVRAADGLVRLS
jgi:acyl-CoA synthetase (NDP forming)